MSTHDNHMSALISLSAWPETTRGYHITARASKTARCALQPWPVHHRKKHEMNARNVHKSPAHARVHLFARCVQLEAEAARFDAAIAANLKELGYGG